ncbi:scabin-related ADP-ribosyltransferase [Paraburkholderia aspalathi]|uniref:scabin-related ADP-ribosyltransferase n=1 Tax=Paraburkholderia aspalathi TaxID=1324617 RepID=UPI0038B8A097
MKAQIAQANHLDPVEHEMTVPLYRTDTRRPSQIFQQGFLPRGNSLNIEAHTHASISDAGPSHFVSTTLDSDAALNHGFDVSNEQGASVHYVYKLSRRVPGINVTETATANNRTLTLGGDPEAEVLIPGGVNQQFIKTAWQIARDACAVQKFKNSNYAGSDKDVSDDEIE